MKSTHDIYREAAQSHQYSVRRRRQSANRRAYRRAAAKDIFFVAIIVIGAVTPFLLVQLAHV